MTTTEALVAFTGAAGLLTITPGLDTALVLRTAAVEGARRAMLAGLGICVGCLTWGLAVSVGLGALLAASQLAYDLLRACGAAYLVWLGSRMILNARLGFLVDANGPARTSGEEPAARWFARGFLTNMLNPKVGVFYVTFLPQFVPEGVAVTPFSVLLASIHALEGVLWFAALVAATKPVSAWLRQPRVSSALDRATGAVLVGFGLKLAFSGRDKI